MASMNFIECNSLLYKIEVRNYHEVLHFLSHNKFLIITKPYCYSTESDESVEAYSSINETALNLSWNTLYLFKTAGK